MSVTVWWASPAHAQQWHTTLLTEAESVRAAAYRRAEDRDRFVVANALLRLSAADHLGLPEVTIDRACDTCGEPHGKPAIPGSTLEVSISHSGDWVAVALTELGPVGVDVEEIKHHADLTSMLRYVFSPSELAALPNPQEHFYQAWTRKESVLKATGQGLRVRMSDLTVLPETGEYNLRDLAPRPGYAAAVTVLSEASYTVTELDGAQLLTR